MPVYVSKLSLSTTRIQFVRSFVVKNCTGEGQRGGEYTNPRILPENH